MCSRIFVAPAGAEMGLGCRGIRNLEKQKRKRSADDLSRSFRSGRLEIDSSLARVNLETMYLHRL